MSKNKKNSRITILICFLIAVIVFYFVWLKPKPAAAPMSGMHHAAEVNVMEVKKQDLQLFIELPGRVSAYKISDVRPQIEGVIKKRKFVEGSFVKEGQQLYQIDPTIYQSNFESASANYKTLLAKKNRYQPLLEAEAISKQEFDDVKAAFEEAASALKRAKANLNYTKVLAPISGYIGKSNVTEGSLVTINQPQILTTITQLDPIYVDLTQPTKDLKQLEDQQDVPVSVITDDSNYQNIGTLKFSEVFADESTDSVRLRALFTNKDKKLIPGMFVNAKIHLRPIKAITVPQRATNRMPDGSLMVFTVNKENIAQTRIIKAEQIFNDSWIISEGLEEGEIIITEGFLKITDGAKVNPVFAKPPEEKK